MVVWCSIFNASINYELSIVGNLHGLFSWVYKQTTILLEKLDRTVHYIFIFLNQFQWWQLRNYILDPYRTTKAYYWSIFLKTKPDASTAKLKRVERDFSGGFEFKNREEYIKKNVEIGPLMTQMTAPIFKILQEITFTT